MSSVIKEKMKIGILTATRTDNNGTDLQALAMQNLFSKYCKNVELINYECAKLESSKRLFKPLCLKDILKLPISLYMHIAHNKFRHNFNWSKQKYNSDNISRVLYDKIIVGSDQIWNLQGTGYDLNFFLPFQTDCLKYSYAASLGRADIRDWNVKYKLAEHLRTFRSVSVRERSGVDALKEIGINARYDLDPILMGTESDWLPFISLIPRKYVFLLLVEENDDAINYAKNYAMKHGCEIIMPSNGLKYLKGIKQKRFVGVEKWLCYMYSADLIVTNSYHTLSFAILFKKSFVLFKLNENSQSNVRMIDLLSSLKLNDRICDGKQLSIQSTIDWNIVYSLLNKLRDNSEAYVAKIMMDKDA